MRKFYTKTILVLVFSLVTTHYLSAQTRLLDKMKDKMEDKIIEDIFETDGQKSSSSGNQSRSENTSGSNVKNTTGGGLDNTGPSVEENLDNAMASLNSKSYSNARYSMRQAMMTIEMEIGKNVLESFPEEVNGLPFQSNEDEVTSTGIGFIGLTIKRAYRKDNKELEVIVANNSAWISAINIYLSNPAYASSSSQEYKQTTFQGHRGVIEYDEYSGYKLSVPFGQSSIFVLQGVNFNTEQEVMSAADKFSIEKIKSKIGEK